MHITTAPRTATDDLLVVANTRHGPGGHYRVRAADGPPHDHLADAAEARAYLVDHAVPTPDGLPDGTTLGRLGRLRDVVRGLAGEAPGREPQTGVSGAVLSPAATEPIAVLDELASGVTFRLAGGAMVPVRGGWAGFADALLPAAIELVFDHGALRLCGNPRCRFAFLDRSRNRSRVWCESAVCGNRVRVGRHRRRVRHVAPTG
jgi:predicted RNA-binding Zn ribbon-like protein